MATERERAAYYEAHKDDPAEWGEPLPARKVPRRRLGAMLSLRLTAEQFRHIASAARRRDMSVSAFVRAAAIEAANNQSQNPSGNSGWGTVVQIRRSA